MKKTYLKYLATLLFVTLCAKASAIVTLVGFDAVNLTGWGPSPWDATSINSAVTSAELVRGTGVSLAYATNYTWGGSYFSGTRDDAISNDDLFNLTVDFGSSTVDLSGIDYNLRRSSSGPNTFRWQYSFDASTFNDIGSSDISYTGTDTNGEAQNLVNLTGIAPLQGLSGVVYFRFVPFGASGSGTLGFGRLTGDDLALKGEIATASVPESGTTLAFLGLGVFGLILFRRLRC